MEIKCNRTLLVQAMQVVQTVVASRTPIPILQNVKLTASKKELQIFGSDLEVGIRYTVPLIASEGEGSAVVPADKIASYVREMSDDEVRIVLKAAGAEIVGANCNLNIAGSEPADFPAFPEFDVKSDVRVAAKDLVEMAQKTVFAASREPTRYALTGVLLETQDDELRMVASDGKRLAYAKRQVDRGLGSKFHIVVPPKALQLLEKSAAARGLLSGPTRPEGGKGAKEKEKDKEGFVRLNLEENQVKMLLDGVMIFSRLVEGSFPNYENVIPKGNDKRVQVATEELAAAMRRLSVLTTDRMRAVTLNLAKGKLLLVSKEKEVGEVHEEMAVKYDGDDVLASFNADYFLDVLRVVGCPEVTLELKDPETACVIKAKHDFVYLVMPLSLPE
ncbi:MAG: DNA polymerase III subunit beta [Planctomycetota bacterium]|nr:DNA polymerase III subunit beta [Planctomycetota bacterium]